MDEMPSIEAEAAQLLRRLLDAVESEELEAPGPVGARLLRRIEGAASALEVAAKPRRRRHSSA